MQTKYITCADTAKLIRTALKENFPAVKFTVKSKTYSGGASINVGWTDGPTEKQVKTITNAFEGADFDGMQDLKIYRNSELNGEPVSYGADFIFTNRTNSLEFVQEVAKKTCKSWGVILPDVRVNRRGHVEIAADHDRIGGSNFTLAELIYQDARKTFFFNGLRCMEKRA